MMTPPLYRRHLALDDDDPTDWAPNERARFIDRARRRAAAYDADIIRAGRELLDAYRGPGMTTRDALRAFMRDLMERTR